MPTPAPSPKGMRLVATGAYLLRAIPEHRRHPHIDPMALGLRLLGEQIKIEPRLPDKPWWGMFNGA